MVDSPAKQQKMRYLAQRRRKLETSDQEEKNEKTADGV
jgi:hypothetical protein